MTDIVQFIALDQSSDLVPLHTPSQLKFGLGPILIVFQRQLLGFKEGIQGDFDRPVQERLGEQFQELVQELFHFLHIGEIELPKGLVLEL